MYQRSTVFLWVMKVEIVNDIMYRVTENTLMTWKSILEHFIYPPLSINSPRVSHKQIHRCCSPGECSLDRFSDLVSVRGEGSRGRVQARLSAGGGRDSAPGDPAHPAECHLRIKLERCSRCRCLIKPLIACKLHLYLARSVVSVSLNYSG